jgi:hypothetical protein
MGGLEIGGCALGDAAITEDDVSCRFGCSSNRASESVGPVA